MTSSSGRRVLLVEDTPDDRWVLAELLRSRGHTVTAYEDAESAWEAYQEAPFPLVILDWILPGMDGLQLCRKVRGHPEGDGSVILVVTIRKSPEDLEEVLRAGANDYIWKPLDVGLMNVRLAVAEEDLAVMEARHHSQRQLEALFRNLDQVFFSVDVTEERLIQVSSAARTVLGREPEELLSDPSLWRELLYPREVQEQQESLARSPPGRSVTHQKKIHRPDGEIRWIEATLKPTLDEDGALIRVDGFLSDWTERKRAQEELAVRNQELRTLHRISEIVMGARTAEEAYGEILEEVCGTTGYPVAAVEHLDPTRSEMVTRAARGIPRSNDGEHLRIPLNLTPSGEAVQKGTPVVVEDLTEWKGPAADELRQLGLRTFIAFPMVVSGEVRCTLVLAHTESRSPDGRLLRWGGSLANTVASFLERLHAAGALRESERRQRRVAEQLRQANAELEAFTYSIAHDLRTPLRTMQGFAHALSREHGDDLDPEARDYLERILKSGRWADSLIRDLLDYSRISVEEMELEEVDFESVVNSVLEGLDLDLKEAGAEVEVARPLPRVQGDQTALIQILSNLVSNAARFVPPDRTPRIRVAAETGEDGVRITVEDNGIGIPEGQEERIFGVFERLSDGGDDPGTGIGLAIVRRLVEKLGGSVGVEPAPTRGSRFWIHLPEEPEEEIRKEPTARSRAIQPGGSLS